MSKFTVTKEAGPLEIAGIEFAILTPGSTYTCPDEVFPRVQRVLQATKGQTVTKVQDQFGNIVTGSRSSGLALSNLLTTLANAGIIQNSTSA